ncbi:GntR family transcriptional regulator [Caballeronia novacaledonica]|nr:GntR family transcriptional regulator [Caballeronia novacaledonica]
MAGMDEIVPVENETLGQRVYAQLREMLIAGQFAPGENLTLRTIARAIGTSPMPVRDALRQLMVDQAIELLPNRAFRVPLMSRERFVELRDIRLQVEGMAAERAAIKASDAEIKEAEQAAQSFDRECRGNRDPGKLILFNKSLHFAVYRASRMPALMQIIEGLWSQIGPVLNLDIRGGSQRISNMTPCEFHSRLVQALRDKDPVGARAALTADIVSAAEDILRVI